MAAERKEKLSVTDKNQEYLRNEKAKMGRQLEKEQVNRRALEDQVNLLLEQTEGKASALQETQSRYQAAERKRKQEVLRAEKACKERDEAVQSLQRKSRLLKQHETTLQETQQEMERVGERNKSLKVWPHAPSPSISIHGRGWCECAR